MHVRDLPEGNREHSQPLSPPSQVSLKASSSRMQVSSTSAAPPPPGFPVAERSLPSSRRAVPSLSQLAEQ
nr:hypothetical protein Itr_chr09CG16680 [Ipomoea trifida]